MVTRGNSKALEVAGRYLTENGSVDCLELCSRALMIETDDRVIATRLVAALLDDDLRFRQDEHGIWHAAAQAEDEFLSCPETPLREAEFVVVDVETTGARKPPEDRVMEIGCVKVCGGEIIDQYESLINPRRPIPSMITGLTGISWGMVADQPEFAEIAEKVLDFIGDSVFVAHNAPFDWRFVGAEISLSLGVEMLNRVICTRLLAIKLVPELARRSLGDLADFFNLDFAGGRHRALGDARVTALALIEMLEKAEENSIGDLRSLARLIQPQSRKKKARNANKNAKK